MAIQGMEARLLSVTKICYLKGESLSEANAMLELGWRIIEVGTARNSVGPDAEAVAFVILAWGMDESIPLSTPPMDAGTKHLQIDQEPPQGADTAAWGKGEYLVWHGRKIPLVKNDGLWRARKRSKALSVNIPSGTPNLADAKKIIRAELERQAANPTPTRSTDTLADVAKVYLASPKRASQDNAQANVDRLKKVVEVAWGKTLKQAMVADVDRLWPAYVAKRQGGKVPDYNTRLVVNRGINSAMRLARSIFIRTLLPVYEAAGIRIPANAANVMWLPEPYTPPVAVDEDAVVAAWRSLPRGSLWWVIGLARFAGLRRSEILALRGKWVLSKGNAVYIDLRDRPEDKYWTKTGRPYTALVMDAEFGSALQGLGKEQSVISEDDSRAWIEKRPQEWLTGVLAANPPNDEASTLTRPRLPLHRLRGLYADHVKRETESSILARAEAIKEASMNLGHTSIFTTTASYITPDALPAGIAQPSK